MNADTPSSYFDTSPEAQLARARKSKGASRAKLARRFLEDTYAAWEEQGEQALRRAAFHDPVSFVNMVARLMPQKIEVSHPVDGMSDDRLAELLAFAERMAELRAANPDAHKTMIDVSPKRLPAAEGGGGPERLGAAGGEGCPSSDRDGLTDQSAETHNKLEATVSPALLDAEAAILPYPVGRPQPRSDYEVERMNLAKRAEGFEDIDPESLF